MFNTSVLFKLSLFGKWTPLSSGNVTPEISDGQHTYNRQIIINEYNQIELKVMCGFRMQ